MQQQQQQVKPKLSYEKICTVARKHCKLIESHRSPCITPTALYNTGGGDCFVVLKNPTCRFGTVSLDHTALGELDVGVHWLVLYLNDALYLVDRADCGPPTTTSVVSSSSSARQHRKIVDGFLLLELQELIQLPSVMESTTTTEENSSDQLTHTDNIIIDTRRERHPYVQNHYQTHRYDDLVMEKTAMKYQTRTLIPYTLFSLPQYLSYEDADGKLDREEDDSDDDYVRRDTVSEYMHYIYDYALIYSHFKNADHRVLLENKLLTYYQTHAGRVDDSPHTLMVHCMLNMAHCESPDSQPIALFDKSPSVRYATLQDIRCRALDECVSWELFRLRRASEAIPTVKFVDLVQHHRRYMCEMRQEYDVPLPVWLSYTLTNHAKQQVFWISTPLTGSSSSSSSRSTQRESDSTYAVAFEWGPLLYEMAASSQVAIAINATCGGGGGGGGTTGITFIHGRITLSYTVFRDVFLPLLYRQTLTDSFGLAVLLRCQIAAHLTRSLFKPWRMYGWFRDEIYTRLPNPMCVLSGASGSTTQWSSRGSLQSITSRGYANEMYQYCMDHHNLDSPVLRKLTRRDNYMQLDDNPDNKQRQAMSDGPPPMHTISHLIDIEDLADRLPLCIAGILTPGKYLRHRDRLAAVSYLIDMGYQMEQVLTYLRANKRDEITALYKSQVIKKRKEPNGSVSLGCNGQFSLDMAYGNTTRCPYEARCNGAEKKRRDDYGDVKERMKVYGEFKSACTRSLELDETSRINHPIDYIHYKLKMRDSKSVS